MTTSYSWKHPVSFRVILTDSYINLVHPVRIVSPELSLSKLHLHLLPQVSSKKQTIDEIMLSGRIFLCYLCLYWLIRLCIDFLIMNTPVINVYRGFVLVPVAEETMLLNYIFQKCDSSRVVFKIVLIFW